MPGRQTPSDPAQELRYPALTQARGPRMSTRSTVSWAQASCTCALTRSQIELRVHDIPYEVKKEITIRFRGQPTETHNAAPDCG